MKWAVEYLEHSRSLVLDPTSKRGEWKQNNKRLHIEIGCGKGKYSFDMAKMYPEDTFVAIEKNESAAGMAAKRFDEEKLQNLSLIHGDAQDLDTWFGNEEVDTIHLNFSDPWPKNRNAKRRLSSASFLKQYQSILSPNGQIQMKTDNQKLFEYSILEFLNQGFQLDDISVDYRRDDHPEDAITEYEEKFISLGQPIYRCVFVKPGSMKK